jgi:hypothetical protein
VLLSYNKGNKKYPLSDPLWKSSPTHSFLDPFMLMRPSTLNSKCIVSGKQQKIEIAPVWDGNRQKVDLLLANFQAYLTDRKNINEKKEKEESRRQ